MSAALTPPLAQPAPGVPFTYGRDPSAYRWAVWQYQRMVEFGILTADDKVELLEGHVVYKMPRNPPHDGTVLRLTKRLRPHLPAGWDVRAQSALVLPDGQPEPDVAVVREQPDDYTTRHPEPRDVGLLVEVADTSLLYDRRAKAGMYARAGVAVYWIANIPDRSIEAHTQPSGGAYAAVTHYHPGDLVPLVLDGVAVARIPAADLLP
jgi:Uma2 family endonuclease